MTHYVPARPLKTAAAAVYTYTRELEERFTWIDRFDREYRAYRRSGDFILLPRECCPLGREDRRAAGVPIDLKAAHPPRNDSQRAVLRSSLDELRLGGTFQVQADTGWGKTWLGSQLIAAAGRRALVVVPDSDLLGQWRRELVNHLGLDESEIGLMRQSTCDVAGKKVVLGIIHSLAKADGRWDAAKGQFGLLLLDEVHRTPADEFGNVCFEFPARYRVGMTATPRRADGRDRLIRAHCGEIAVVGSQIPMQPRVLLYRSGWRCPRDGNGGPIPHAPGKDAHVIRILSRWMPRNRALARAIAVMHQKGRRVVVFSHRREHLETLADLTRGQGVPPSDVGFYVGQRGTGPGAEQRLREAASRRVVFATYKMLSTWTNVPVWDAAILATPASGTTHTQAIGRVLREHPGKKQPVIVDFVDDDSPLYRRYARARRRTYDLDKYGGEVVELDRI